MINKDSNYFWYFVSYFSLFLLVICFSFIKGPAYGVDSVHYINSADALINWLTTDDAFEAQKISNLIYWLISSSFIITAEIFYFGYMIIVTLSKFIGGENWAYFLIFFQSLLIAFMVIPILYVLRVFFSELPNYLCCIISVILPFFHPEVIILSRYVLTDIPFVGLLSLFTFIFLSNHEYNNKIIIKLLLLLLFIFFIIFRPDYLSWLCASLFLILIMKLNINNIKYAIFFSFIFIILFLLFASWFIYKPQTWPFIYGSDLLVWVRKYYLEGVIIHHQFGTYSNSPVSFIDFSLITLKRFVYYFQYWNENYSTIHNLYRHLYFTPIYFFSIYYYIKSFARYSSLNNIEKKLILFSLLLIIFNNLLHTLTIIAYEFRYQLIIFPLLWPISVLGIKELYKDAKKLFNY